MYFELVEFLETLNGLTREECYQAIISQQEELMREGSQPKINNGEKVVFRSFKAEIDFLNKLGNEVGKGWIVRSNFIERRQIDNVLRNLSNQ